MSSESFNSSEKLTASHSKALGRLRFALVVILFVLFFCSYQTVAFEMTCTRTLENGVECRIVPHSILRTLEPIQVKHPLSVDVTQKKPLIHVIRSPPAMVDGKAYRAEMRIEGRRDSLILISSFRYETIQKIADTINQFLQDPDIPSFQACLPKGRMKQNSISP